MDDDLRLVMPFVDLQAENDHLRERVRNLERIALEMHATLDHTAEDRGETCWSCFLQCQLTELFIGYDPARYDGHDD